MKKTHGVVITMQCALREKFFFNFFRLWYSVKFSLKYFYFLKSIKREMLLLKEVWILWKYKNCFILGRNFALNSIFEFLIFDFWSHWKIITHWLIFLASHFRGAFRTCQTSKMERFLSAVNYFRRVLNTPLRSITYFSE